MTGHADPEAVRAYYDHVDEEAYGDLFALFADDVVYERPGQGSIDGIDEFRAFYRDGRPLERGRHELYDLVADGDVVAVRGSFSGVQGGEPVSFGFADFHVFDGDGRIFRRYSYTDRDEL